MAKKIETTDEEIRDIAKKFVKGLLSKKSTTDMCYLVCQPLQAYLYFLNVDCKLTEGEIKFAGNEWHHFWITLADGRIIDPTANQFIKNSGIRMKNLYVREKPYYYHPYTKKDFDDKIQEAIKTFSYEKEKTNPKG